MAVVSAVAAEVVDAARLCEQSADGVVVYPFVNPLQRVSRHVVGPAGHDTSPPMRRVPKSTHPDLPGIHNTDDSRGQPLYQIVNQIHLKTPRCSAILLIIRPNGNRVAAPLHVGHVQSNIIESLPDWPPTGQSCSINRINQGCCISHGPTNNQWEWRQQPGENTCKWDLLLSNPPHF